MNPRSAIAKHSPRIILLFSLALSLQTFAYAHDKEAMNLNAQYTDLSAADSHDYEKVKVISRGKLINVLKYIEPGKYTAFLFYADWCAPCKTLKPRLEQLARSVDNLALREIDIINWENPLAAYYNLPSIPYFIIYGPDGNFIERGPAITDETLKDLTGGD